MSLSRLIGGFVRQHVRAYVSAAAMLTGVAALTVWVPRRIGAMIDAMAAHRLAGPDLWWNLAALLAAGVCIYFLRVAWRLTLFAAAYQLGVQLRTRLYERLARQGPSFYQRQRTGDLMALATNDIDAIEMAAGEAMLAGFDGSLTLLMVLAIMLLGVDWRLACIALLPFPLMALAFWRISSHIHAASTDSLKRFSALNDHVQESLAGVRTLRALGLEARSDAQFTILAGHAADASLTAQKWEAAYEPAVGLTLTTASALTLGLGGYLVWQQHLTIGALTSFSMYLGQLIWPMFAAGWVLSLIERGRAAWARLQPMLEAPLAIDDHGTLATLTPGPLVLRGVHAAYAGHAQETVAQKLGSDPIKNTGSDHDEKESIALAAWSDPDGAPRMPATAVTLAPVAVADVTQATATSPPAVATPDALHDISLQLLPGQTLGLVGPTGSGKSSLLRVLLRQLTPHNGSVTWGGHALHDYTLHALRAAISWVPQESFLFSASIADNIALALPGASLAQVQAAAQLADIHDDILGFPDGYQTEVGERGITLSGGQRQRVAIARALLADSALLLLDDALSAVDTGTETRILQHLRELQQQRRERSVIIASHRLSAVVNADLILVLRAGRISESGSHDELLARDGWYASQWRYQQLEASLDAL